MDQFSWGWDWPPPFLVGFFGVFSRAVFLKLFQPFHLKLSWKSGFSGRIQIRKGQMMSMVNLEPGSSIDMESMSAFCRVFLVKRHKRIHTLGRSRYTELPKIPNLFAVHEVYCSWKHNWRHKNKHVSGNHLMIAGVNLIILRKTRVILRGFTYPWPLCYYGFCLNGSHPYDSPKLRVNRKVSPFHNQ